jgi:hypothetical protein
MNGVRNSPSITGRPQGARQQQFRIVLLGEAAVGKTSFVLRFVEGKFFDRLESTIGGKMLMLYWSYLLLRHTAVLWPGCSGFHFMRFTPVGLLIIVVDPFHIDSWLII